MNTRVMSPDWSRAVRTWLDTPRPVMFPESFMISARPADRELTVMSPEWSVIVALPEIRMAWMSPESVLSMTVPARPLADRLPDAVETSERVTLLCGVGCADAHDEVIRLADKLQAPIVHTLRGKEYLEYDNWPRRCR